MFTTPPCHPLSSPFSPPCSQLSVSLLFNLFRRPPPPPPPPLTLRLFILPYTHLDLISRRDFHFHTPCAVRRQPSSSVHRQFTRLHTDRNEGERQMQMGQTTAANAKITPLKKCKNKTNPKKKRNTHQGPICIHLKG